MFISLIKKLTNEFPEDAKNEDGKRIWKGYYRFPTLLALENGDEYIEYFILSAAKIFAKMLNIPISPINIDKVLENKDTVIDLRGNINTICLSSRS